MAKEAEGVDAEEDFLDTMRKRHKLCIEAEDDNRKRAKEALRFRDLEQWDPIVSAERTNDPEGARPCLVVDKLNQHVNQVVNDERQNRPQIKVRPGDGVAHPEVAKIYDGMMRQMQYRSHADIAYDTGFECAVDGGFGYWRLLTEFCDAMSFEQELKIMRIRNRFSVYLDPERKEPDGSDSNYGFIFYKVQRKDFKKEFGVDGEDALAGFESEGREFVEWYGDDWVMYCEYFFKDKKKETIALLEYGKPGVPADQVPEGVPVLETRETEVTTIRWSKVTATKILDGYKPGGTGDNGKVVFDRIPIVEVTGNELDIEGRVKKSGMIRGAMDAQRVDNYSTSAFVESVALAPRASWVAAVGQMEGNEELWRTANRRNISVLPYKPITVEGVVVGAPQRVQPAGVSQGWLSVMEQSQFNVMAAMGRYNASLGQPSNETSGKAIANRAREGDVGSFHFTDNLTRSLTFTGQMCVDAWPKLITYRKTVQIIGEDGSPTAVILDPNLADANGKPIPYAEQPNAETGKMEKVYNLSCGKYEVVVTPGPSYTTRRLESADAMMEISRGNPEFLQKFGDIIFKAQDWPGADQVADRFKKMLPPELQEKDDGQDEKAQLARQTQQVQEAVKALGQREAELQAQEQAIAEATQEAEGKIAQAGQQDQKAKDAMRRVEAEVEKLNAATAALENEKKLLALEKKLAEQQLKMQTSELESEKEVARAEVRALQAEMTAVHERMELKLQEVNDANALLPERTDHSAAIAETNKAVMAVTEALAEVRRLATAPRELIYDANGEPVGAKIVLEEAA